MENGHAPSSFSNTWQTQAQRNPDLNPRNATDIYIPFPRIDLFKRMPLYAMPHPGTLMTLSDTAPTVLPLDMHFKTFYTQRPIRPLSINSLKAIEYGSRIIMKNRIVKMQDIYCF
jgi:hypothetical protein